MTPEMYKRLSFFDRRCVIEALDELLRRENGDKDVNPEAIANDTDIPDFDV